MRCSRLYQELAAILVCGGLLLCAGGCGTAALSAMGAPAHAEAADGGESRAENRPMRLYLPEASGTRVYSGAGITVDASNTAQGYFMVRCDDGGKRLKLQVSCDGQSYAYNLTPGGGYETFPCQMGSGSYLVRVLENVTGDMYAQLFTQELNVTLESAQTPFLYPSQFVSFDASSEAVARSYLLVDGTETDSDAAKALYRFVVKNTAYDYDKAATVEKGYVPDPDETLSSGRGICFDYSALLASMLRAQGIPAQLVIGVVMPEGITHAWNRVWLGGEWVWMDATLDGTGHKEKDYTGERVY